MILSCRVLSNIVILSRRDLYHYVGEVTHQDQEFSIKARTITQLLMRQSQQKSSAMFKKPL